MKNILGNNFEKYFAIGFQFGPFYAEYDKESKTISAGIAIALSRSISLFYGEAGVSFSLDFSLRNKKFSTECVAYSEGGVYFEQTICSYLGKGVSKPLVFPKTWPFTTTASNPKNLVTPSTFL